ncbi:DUF3102 domain-containing protein [Ensifer sp. IC4062]|nr:DUF3102 domain-containing protein [Ensifer sp. IC4062]
MTGQTNSAAVLAGLAEEINAHADAQRACEMKGLMHVIRIGELLHEAKKVTPHGGFMAWVKANTKVSQRMAQMYMQIAADERVVGMIEHEYETVSHLTFRKAVELAGRHRREEKLVERCKTKWAEAAEHRREFVRRLGEVRERGFKGADEAFTSWLIEKAGIGRITAERAPRLLDRDYDDEAWVEAMLDDIEASEAERATSDIAM